MEGKKNILIIKLGAFGDIIMAEGAIHDIRNNFKDDHISVLTSPAYKKIFERCPWVDTVLLTREIPAGVWTMMRKLNRRIGFDDFDVIFDLQRANRTSFYYRWFVKKASWSGMAAGCDLPYSYHLQGDFGFRRICHPTQICRPLGGTYLITGANVVY